MGCLKHVGCGGSIVINVTSAIAVFAPSFSVNTGGLSNLTLDIEATLGYATPDYYCKKCNASFSGNKIGTDIVAVCQICGEDYIADNLYVHTRVSTICKTCLEAIKSSHRGGSISRINEFIETFDMSGKDHFVPLVKVLSFPIKI